MSIALVVRRVIRAPADRLFEAWTTPAQLVAWWGPRGVRCTDAEVDLRVGGRYRIDNELPDGRVLVISGAFEVIEPPRRLVYSWRVGDPQREADDAADERVTVRFDPAEGGTEVVVVHEGIATQATREGHEHGWIGCLEGLDRIARVSPP